MAARRIERTPLHRVMKGSRDCGVLGWSLHKPDEGMGWPRVPTGGRPPWVIG